MRCLIQLAATAILLLSAPVFATVQETADSTKKNGSDNPASPISINIPAPEITPGVSRPPLQGIILDLGDNLRLERPYRAQEQAPEGCIERPGLTARFCLDPVKWPADLANAFNGTNVIYKGSKAIIRYDNDKASQAHILFPAQQFIDVVEHLKGRFGPPTEEEMVKIPVPEADDVINTVVRWRSVMDDTKGDLILEIRAYDDIRRPFPDSDHGFIWLYRKGATPVFRHLSAVDLMVLRKRHIGQWPYK